MKRTLLATLGAALLGLFATSCQTYDPNDPNDPFNRQLDATYGAPTYGAPAYGAPQTYQTPAPYSNPAAPLQSQAPPRPQPKPKPAAAPARGDIGRVLELTNMNRTRNGSGYVQPDARLTRAAQIHSEYLASTQVLGHVGPRGERAGARMLGQNYVWRAFAENVGYGKTADEVVNQWMSSSAHRANLLNPIYNEVGVGYSNGYWTIVFGRHK